jgi:hypothetical protein
MAGKPKKPKESYLKTPNRIMNIPRSLLNQQKKALLAHIYSFGAKGCWQSNRTLAEMFQTSERSITRWISDIKKIGEIYIKSPKGYYRTIWAKSHPEVIAANKLWYRNKQIPKEDINHPVDFAKNGEQDRQNWRSESAKNGIRLRQNCLTINNNTLKETIKNTTTTPTPLPAGGQAPALLQNRQEEAKAQFEQLKRRIGMPGRRSEPELTPAESDQRKQQLIQALLASEKNKKFY